MTGTLRVAASAARATILSPHAEVLDRAEDHLAPWWTVHRPARAGVGSEPDRRSETPALDDVLAGLTGELAAAAARDLVGAQLEAAGWTLLRAAAVTRTGRALVITGPDPAPASAALRFGRAHWGVLALDQMWARPSASGVSLLPHPTAATVRLGLLDDLGFLPNVLSRLAAEEPPATDRDPRLGATVDELRSHPDWQQLTVTLSPAQLASWCGLILAPLATGVAVVSLTGGGPTRRRGSAPAAAGHRACMQQLAHLPHLVVDDTTLTPATDEIGSLIRRASI